MRMRSVTALALAAIALLLLTSCVRKGEMERQMAADSAAQDWFSTRTMIAGNEADTVLVDDQLLEEAVQAMGATGDSKDIKRLIREVRDADNGRGGRGLSGLGGAYGHAFLDVAELALKADGRIDRQEKVSTTTFGKIIDYAYVPSEKDPRIGSGKIHVITMVETVKRRRVAGPGAPGPLVRRQGFKWEISVAPGGFEIHEKVAGPQPFPGTMDFSIAMVTRVELLGFKYKLWAKGKKISTDSVYISDNFNPAKWDDPSVWTLIPKTGPVLKRYQRLYDIDDESCIDLMFVPYKRGPHDPVQVPIPVNMTELRQPPFYCLGRCANPPIINTR